MKAIAIAALAGGVSLLAAVTEPRRAGDANLLEQAEPTLAAVFADYKLTGEGGLPLRTAREDWDGARARVRSDAASAAWVADRRARLEDWIANRGDDARWIAGWGHDLVAPGTGTPLVWAWTMPEPDRAGEAGAKLHGAWVQHRRAANIDNVQEAARLYRLTGEARLRDWAAAQLDFYAVNYAQWPVQRRSGRSRMMGQSLDEAVAAATLADAARLIDDGVAAERRQAWNAGLFEPLLRNLQASNRGIDNISVWQASAAAILALRLGLEPEWRQAIEGPNGIRAMLNRGVLADYLWFEPSVGYAAYVQQALGHLFVAASLAGRGDALRKEMLLAQDMLISQAAMRFADGTLPVTGDSAPGTQAFDPAVLALTQRVMPIRAMPLPPSWATLIDPPGASIGPAPAERASRRWDTAQAAILRRDGWELFFHYGQRVRSHAQFDALSYEARYEGVVVTAAPGVAAYGSPLFLDHLRRSAAHVMPMIDGDGQVRIEPGVLIGAGDAAIAASQPGFAGRAQVVRRIALRRGALEERTAITMKGGGTHRLGGVFNTPCRVSAAARMTAAGAPAGTGFGYWRGTTVSPATSIWTATLDCGGVPFRLVLSADRPGRVFVSAAPDRAGALVRTAIYFETTAAALRLATRIVPR